MSKQILTEEEIKSLIATTYPSLDGDDWTPVFPEERRDVCAIKCRSENAPFSFIESIHLVWKDQDGFSCIRELPKTQTILIFTIRKVTINDELVTVKYDGIHNDNSHWENSVTMLLSPTKDIIVEKRARELIKKLSDEIKEEDIEDIPEPPGLTKFNDILGIEECCGTVNEEGKILAAVSTKLQNLAREEKEKEKKEIMKQALYISNRTFWHLAKERYPRLRKFDYIHLRKGWVLTGKISLLR